MVTRDAWSDSINGEQMWYDRTKLKSQATQRHLIRSMMKPSAFSTLSQRCEVLVPKLKSRQPSNHCFSPLSSFQPRAYSASDLQQNPHTKHRTLIYISVRRSYSSALLRKQRWESPPDRERRPRSFARYLLKSNSAGSPLFVPSPAPWLHDSKTARLEMIGRRCSHAGQLAGDGNRDFRFKSLMVGGILGP